MIISELKDEEVLRRFMDSAGNVSAFRYFSKRPLSSIKEHWVTLIGMEGDDPVCYGHLNSEGWLGVCVVEGRRGEGLGKKMMSSLIEFGRQKKIGETHLIVDASNIGARSMYEKFGFKESLNKDGKVYYEWREKSCNSMGS